MRKRKFAGKMTGESSLPDLLNRLELALAGMPDHTSVCKALSDLNRRLGSPGEQASVRSGRPTASRRPRPRQMAMQSLPLFS
ncbi:hypothetical protein B0G73_10340 [Paraburkholderia sp. BL25I1N1]|nr:hypothetical protein B0G73_10340 [Paraburkholderia sp. BL25I1N1]